MVEWVGQRGFEGEFADSTQRPTQDRGRGAMLHQRYMVGRGCSPGGLGLASWDSTSIERNWLIVIENAI